MSYCCVNGYYATFFKNSLGNRNTEPRYITMNKKNYYKSLILTTVVKIENNILRYVVKIALLEAMSLKVIY